MAAGIAVVGGGQAGYQVVASLRAKGYDGPLRLISEEPYLPYQRPPLSKGYLTGKQDEAALPFRPQAFYEDHAVDLMLGCRVEALDRRGRRLRLGKAGDVGFATLVLALGSRPRRLPLDGCDLAAVCLLRTRDDALEIKQRLAESERVVVIGGGFIGLEVAAAAASLGRSVTVLEADARLMGRVVAPPVSEHFARLHAAHGVTVVLGARVAAFKGASGRVSAVATADGALHPADLVVVGIGVAPTVELAEAAGLACDDGIVVDSCLRSSDPAILAIGDCARHPDAFSGARLRLESVQNAADQAKTAAGTALGEAEPYRVPPWFWTEQFDVKLQMVGLSRGYERLVVRGDPAGNRFSVFYYRDGRLLAIDSINRPAEHILGRKLLAAGRPLPPERAADEAFDLKSLLADGAGGAC